MQWLLHGNNLLAAANLGVLAVGSTICSSSTSTEMSANTQTEHVLVCLAQMEKNKWLFTDCMPVVELKTMSLVLCQIFNFHKADKISPQVFVHQKL